MYKVAMITGITGQDGSYLAEFLLEKGYDCLLYTSELNMPQKGMWGQTLWNTDKMSEHILKAFKKKYNMNF